MRFSKAPLIATLMAVALSLLVILPALAENTNGQVTQGRGTDNQLIVGVYDPNGLASRADRDIPGEGPAPEVAAAFSAAPLPEDTFSNGKLYVSNRHDTVEDADSQAGGYNTVLVTQLGAQGTNCLSVAVKNTRSGGGSIKLALVPGFWRNPDRADWDRVLPKLLPGRGR